MLQDLVDENSKGDTFIVKYVELSKKCKRKFNTTYQKFS
jgi:hypothetical protein